MAKEKWRPVVGHEGEYEVSDQGRVRSLSRTWWQKNAHGGIHQRTMVGRVLKLTVQRFGYHKATIGRNNSRFVHQLVLEAFVGPRPEGQECRHLNGVPTDNRPDNLAWGSHSQNNRDKKWHGNPKKLFVEDVREIRRELARGRCGRDIARDFGVSGNTVSQIKHGRTHADV